MYYGDDKQCTDYTWKLSKVAGTNIDLGYQFSAPTLTDFVRFMDPDRVHVSP